MRPTLTNKSRDPSLSLFSSPHSPFIFPYALSLPRAATSSPGSDAAYEGGATSACRVCGGPPKTYKDYCKSCYGVLYKHIKQIIEIIHRNGSKFNTAGTRQATLKRLKDAAGSARQRSHASCKGKSAVFRPCGHGCYA